VRLTLAEGGMIGLLGGVSGLLMGLGGLKLLAVLSASEPGRQHAQFGGLQLSTFGAPTMDWRVVAFAIVLSLGVGVLATLVPALRCTRGDLTPALKSGARGSTLVVGSSGRPVLLSWIAAAQVTGALVLLVAAGMLLQGLHRLLTVDPGLDTEDVLTFSISPPETRYDRSAAPRLLEQVLEEIESISGVTSASVGRCLPGTGCSIARLYMPGAFTPDDAPRVQRHYVAPDHFSTLGIRLLRGRALTSADRAGRTRVAVISETAARRFWPGEDPIGKRVWFSSGGGFASPDSLTEVVGVVADVRYGQPGSSPEPDFYTSYLQYVLPETMIMVRAHGDPSALGRLAAAAVARVDPAIAIYDVRTPDQIRAEALDDERFATVTIGVFAMLGLLLAAVGVYGVMANSVGQRRREIGIRIAIGATPRDILRQIVGQGMMLSATGVVAGSILSIVVARGLRALIPEAAPFDIDILAVVAGFLLLVTMLTCYLPARTAAQVDPLATIQD
jgi:putative ABC transport system permease protein